MRKLPSTKSHKCTHYQGHRQPGSPGVRILSHKQSDLRPVRFLQIHRESSEVVGIPQLLWFHASVVVKKCIAYFGPQDKNYRLHPCTLYIHNISESKLRLPTQM